jgi:hypothetical protein
MAMLWLALAKLSGAALAWVLYVRGVDSLICLAVVGVAPIWLEVAVSLLTGIEASLEKRPIWLIADNLVDAVVFLISPVAFPSELIAAVNEFVPLLFVFCGLFRLVRFVRQGLVDGLYFEGLPVTYTGYAWPAIAGIILSPLLYWAPLLLLPLCWAMLSKRVRIKRGAGRAEVSTP